MAFLDFLFGTKEKTSQVPRFTEQQQQALESILGQVQPAIQPAVQQLMSILGQDEQSLQSFQQPAMRQFEEDIIPSIAERFTGALGTGAQRSSAFGQQLGKAGESLAEKLAAQRAGLSQQAIGQLQSLLGMGMTPQFENIFQPKQSGFLQSLLTGVAPAAGRALTGGLAGGLF